MNAKIKAKSEQTAQYTTRWSLFVAETWMSSLSLSPAARPVFVSDQLFVCCLSVAGLVWHFLQKYPQTSDHIIALLEIHLNRFFVKAVFPNGM